MSATTRVGIVSTRPSTRRSRIVIVNDTNNSTVRTSNHDECPDKNHKRGPDNADHPFGAFVWALKVIVEPHSSERLHRHKCSKQSADERDERTKVWHSRADDIGCECNTKRARQPCNPMGLGVRDKVLGSLHYAEEDIFGWIVGDEASRSDETGDSEAVTDALEKRASRSKSRRCHVGATEVVNHDTDDDIDSGHRTLADVHGFVVVPGVAHLRHDGKEGGCTSVGEDKGVESGHCLDECGVSNQLVIRNERSILGRSCWTILEAYCDGQSEQRGDDGYNTSPCEPRDLSKSPNRACQEANYGGYGDENSSTCSVQGKGVEGGRDTRKASRSHTDPPFRSLVLHHLSRRRGTYKA